MPDRATVIESAQWALEATPGTSVPATKTIRSMSVEIDMAGEGENFRPDGHKWGQLIIPPHMEWTTWSLAGKPTYTEICYPLESIFGTATVAADVSGMTSVAATDIITSAAHGFVADDSVIFSALVGGAGLTVGIRYFVIATNLTATTFMVSATKGGATVDHTTNITSGTVRLAGLTGRKRTYTILDTVADTAKTLSVEKGQALRAAKLAYGLITDWGFSFSRKNGVSLTGSGIGQKLSDGITMTASPADVALVPIVGKQLDLYIDATAVALGTTKMLRAFLVEPGVANKYGPIWAIDSAQASFAGHVELVPSGTCTIRLEADATGMAYLAQFRAGTTIFVRVQGVGADYEANFPFKLTYDMAFGILSVGDYGRDEDGVTILNLVGEFTRDSTWGKAVEVNVYNNIVTL